MWWFVLVIGGYKYKPPSRYAFNILSNKITVYLTTAIFIVSNDCAYLLLQNFFALVTLIPVLVS